MQTPYFNMDQVIFPQPAAASYLLNSQQMSYSLNQGCSLMNNRLPANDESQQLLREIVKDLAKENESQSQIEKLVLKSWLSKEKLL